MKKVAEVAGVSAGTVSHVITGATPVSESLRAKVHAAIKQLNYHPNYVARSLRTRRTQTLGIIVPDLTIPFFPRVIRGADEAARRKNYSLIALNSDDDADRQWGLLSLLRAQRVDGILLVAAAAATPLNQISWIIDAGIPIVCVDRVPDLLPVDSVSVDDVDAAARGVSYLIELGHRRIAAITGPLELRNERERLEGYRRALDRTGILVDEKLIWNGNLRPRDVAAMCKARLTGAAARPDALFSTNGPTALGVLRALRDTGLHTPQDIGLATFDEITVDDLFSPSIPTVVQPAYEIGFRSAELLLNRINRSISPEPITLRLPAQMKVRDVFVT